MSSSQEKRERQRQDRLPPISQIFSRPDDPSLSLPPLRSESQSYVHGAPHRLDMDYHGAPTSSKHRPPDYSSAPGGLSSERHRGGSSMSSKTYAPHDVHYQQPYYPPSNSHHAQPYPRHSEASSSGRSSSQYAGASQPRSPAMASNNALYPSGPMDVARPNYQMQAEQRISPPENDIMSDSKNKYECSFCGKGFLRPSALKIHLISHTGEKEFVCTEDSCGRRFGVRSNMLRHMRLVHPTSQYTQMVMDPEDR